MGSSVGTRKHEEEEGMDDDNDSACSRSSSCSNPPPPPRGADPSGGPDGPASAPSDPPRRRRRPNVVLLLTDDQGYPPLGAHGHPFLRTPHLDTFLGTEGGAVSLSDFHSGSTCAPTRAGLLTGHWCNSTGVWHTIGGRSLLKADEWSLADALRGGGYKTGIFGKWHLGDNAPYRPQDRGFDTSVIHGGGGIGQQPDWWGNDYFDDCYRVNGAPRKFTGYCTDVFFAEAMEFIEETAAIDDAPFFCYLPTNAPHEPYNVEMKYRDMYYPEKTSSDSYARFLGMISNIDDNFALLRQKLKDLDIEDDTILIFMSDNGQCAIEGCDQYNSGMRGFKGSEYEGGHRVPFAMRYPGGGIGGGGNGGGRAVGELTSYVDVMPTLLDLCGVAVPAGRTFHGDSLASLLRGNGDGDDNRADDEAVTGSTITGQPPNWKERVVVTDTQRIPYPLKWKQCSVMMDKWRLVNRSELYDIAADPGQATDVSGDHPDLVAKLRGGYENWWDVCEMQMDFETPISLGGEGNGRKGAVGGAGSSSSGGEVGEVSILHTHDLRNETDSDVVWNQGQVRAGITCLGWWEVKIETPGLYQFELRRWPDEAGHCIRAGIEGTDIDYREKEICPNDIGWYRGGKALPVDTACLMISGRKQMSKEVGEDDVGATFEAELEGEGGGDGTGSGRLKIRAFFSSCAGYMNSAYYVYVKLLSAKESEKVC